MAKPLTVDEYIGSFSGPAQARLRELRELSRTAAPEATEELKWGHPAYSLETILFMFSGHKNHANMVFTPGTREVFADELSGLTTGKGSVQLPYADPLPATLLTRMIEHRIKEFEVDGVRWM